MAAHSDVGVIAEGIHFLAGDLNYLSSAFLVGVEIELVTCFRQDAACAERSRRASIGCIRGIGAVD